MNPKIVSNNPLLGARESWKDSQLLKCIPLLKPDPFFHAKRLLGQVTKNIQVKCWPSGHVSAKWFKGKHPETHFRDGLMHFLHSHFTVTQKFLEPRRNWSQRKPIHPKLGDRCSFANEEHTGWRSNYIMYMKVLIQMHTYVYQYICVYIYIYVRVLYIYTCMYRYWNLASLCTPNIFAMSLCFKLSFSWFESQVFLPSEFDDIRKEGASRESNLGVRERQSICRKANPRLQIDR